MTSESKFINSVGKEYPYHPNFNFNTGDSVNIVSSDGIAFLINKGLLEHTSSVFRSMFSTCSTGHDYQNEAIPLDHTNNTLNMFFSAAKGQYIQFTKSDWEVFECVLQLCDQYDTSQIAEKLLKHLKPIDIFGVEHLFDLFKIAAKYDDILTATRTIASLRSCGSKEGKKYTLFWSYSQWDEECMKNLPGHWVWACMQAHEETIKGRGADYYWPTVASNFMMILAP